MFSVWECEVLPWRTYKIGSIIGASWSTLDDIYNIQWSNIVRVF